MNWFKKVTLTCFLCIFGLLVGCKTNVFAQTQEVPVYRLNLVGGEHLYTTDRNEVSTLTNQHGWALEGIEWYAPINCGTPVYRIYNAELRLHLYSSDLHEISVLTNGRGWVKDNNGNPVFYSNGRVKAYRLYNPSNYQHFYTISEYERDALKSAGWSLDGENVYIYGTCVGMVYKYCPTVLDGNILYCSNEDHPINNCGCYDFIYLNDSKLILSPTPNSWDSRQVCDPSVVKADVTYKGTKYSYLMAYLGCDTEDCTKNQVGLAVSNDLKNWVKFDKNPVVKHDALNNKDWGAGQPSLLNVNGNVYLFYTKRGTTFVERIYVKSLDNYKRLEKREITTSFDKATTNADFAYKNGTLYMTCDSHTLCGDKWFPDGLCGNISALQPVYSISWDGTSSGLMKLNNNSWKLLKNIGVNDTGHVRNHNACFIRDSYGYLKERAIYVSTADEVVNNWAINTSTYRFQKVSF